MKKTIKTNSKKNGGDIQMRNQKGFSLVELLVVILIIGILIALIVPNFAIMQDRARQTTVKNNMRILYVACGAWAADHMGSLPGEDLETGLIYYMPGGNPDDAEEGSWPTNPYTGAMYVVDEDLMSTGEAWGTVEEYQTLSEEGTDCGYLDLASTGANYGTIELGSYNPEGADYPIGLSIWGYGNNIEDPIRTSGTVNEVNRVYFVYYY